MNNPDKSRIPTSKRPGQGPSGSESFLAELERYGPDATTLSSTTEDQARDYCRRLATTHYENFPVVSRLLPKRLHQHFYNIYAYCRWADDLGDEVGDTTRSLELLDWWECELIGCYAGEAKHPIFVALQETIAKFSIPRDPFTNLIAAFRQDQTVQEYDTFPQLLGYCQNSADPVGRLVLYLCESVNDENFELSDSICTGLQLANFWQDVARDFQIGRVYLPGEDMDQFGVTRETIATGVSTSEFRKLLQFEVDRAREFLIYGLPLIQKVPRDVRIDIDLFINGGLTVLNAIEQIDYHVLERRPKLSKWSFAKLFATSWMRSKMGWTQNQGADQTAGVISPYQKWTTGDAT